MNPGALTVGAGQSIQFRIDVNQVRYVIAGMPKVAYFWIRDFLGRSLVQHRVKWLGTKTTQFGRAGSKSIRVGRVNEGSGALEPNEVRYTVEPDARKMLTSVQAAKGLDVMRAEIGTGNNVLPVHEFGTDLRNSRGMLLPTFKTNQHQPGDFKKWREKNPTKTLLFLPSKRDNKQLIYEVVTKRKRTPPGHVGPPLVDVKLKLRWLVAKFVDMKPTLRLYDSWEDLKSERDSLWRDAADKMFRDLQKADPRDL